MNGEPGQGEHLTDGKNQPTTWGYDAYGRVTNKVDAASNLLFVYQYDPDNRLTNRWSVAKGSTAYTYDAIGNLTHVAYPVSPAISLGYDTLNRLTNMVDAVGTTGYGYDAAGQLLSENGPWASDTVNYTYQNRLRTGMSVGAPNASPWRQGYVYDAMRRLLTVSSPAGAFNYNYGWDGVNGAYWYNWQIGDWDYEYESYPGSRVFGLGLPGGAYITNSFDGNARLLATALINRDGTNLDSYAYTYNQANQRTEVVRTAGDYVNYTYDTMGQLKTAMGKEAGGVTNRWQEQFGYAYDAAGNLNFRTNNTLLQRFDVNNLNELTTITYDGKLTVAGTTTSPATNVTVNTSNAVLYADVTFAATNFTIANGNNTFIAIAKDSYGRKDTNSITVNLPGTNTFVYELNGNMLTNGTEILVWNDENQLVTNFVAGSWKSEFVYDGKLRRRIQRDYSWNGSSWVQTNEIRFIYDGLVIIQHRDANNLPTLTLTRGNDLSEKMQGAGGIGGILAMTESYALNPVHSCFHADGNGNVTMLINSNQIQVAKAEYDPFGGFLALNGSSANPYWFSSKPIHWQSGKYDFLHRWYSPSLQRWPNKDLLGEREGFNLYGYVHNACPNKYDLWGDDIGGYGGGTGDRNNPPDIYIGPKPPEFDPRPWNEDIDNCLAYGVNRPGGPLYPTGSSDGSGTAQDCPGLMSQITNNPQLNVNKLPTSGCCPPGSHRITVYSDGKGGFHIKRQDANGGWSDLDYQIHGAQRCNANPFTGEPYDGFGSGLTPCGILCAPN